MRTLLPRFSLSARILWVIAAGGLLPFWAPAQESNADYEERRARQELGAPQLPRGLPNESTPPPRVSDGATSSGYLVTFFPPTPPIYGDMLPELPVRRSLFNGQKLDAPDALADFVGEIFYAPLSARLFEGGGKAGSKMEKRLALYASSRMTLLDELVGELLRLQTFSKTERRLALQSLAARQAAGLAALEREAEQVRRELVKGGLFSKHGDWNSYRQWRLGSPEVAMSPMKEEAEFQIARATAFFEEGLSIEQRGLLRELASERAREARRVRGLPPSPEDDAAAMFFSPETARLRLRLGLPPDLFARVSRFNSDKAVLKQELLTALSSSDELSPEKRTRHFAALAFEQEKRIAALEKDAEEIRHALDVLSDAPLPWVPPISPELKAQIDSYNRDRGALVTRFRAAQRRATPPPATPAARKNREQRRATAAQEAAEVFEDDHAEEIAALRARYDRIRDALALTADGLRDPSSGRPLTVDSLLGAYRVAMQRFDAIGREVAMYDRYKDAMLQPGLSPAQRRLLFRVAHAGLAQALPTGEVMMSTSALPSPRS